MLYHKAKKGSFRQLESAIFRVVLQQDSGHPPLADRNSRYESQPIFASIPITVVSILPPIHRIHGFAVLANLEIQRRD